jgi:hypothetical protein
MQLQQLVAVSGLKRQLNESISIVPEHDEEYSFLAGMETTQRIRLGVLQVMGIYNEEYLSTCCVTKLHGTTLRK